MTIIAHDGLKSEKDGFHHFGAGEFEGIIKPFEHGVKIFAGFVGEGVVRGYLFGELQDDGHELLFHARAHGLVVAVKSRAHFLALARERVFERHEIGHDDAAGEHIERGVHIGGAVILLDEVMKIYAAPVQLEQKPGDQRHDLARAERELEDPARHRLFQLRPVTEAVIAAFEARHQRGLGGDIAQKRGNGVAGHDILALFDTLATRRKFRINLLQILVHSLSSRDKSLITYIIYAFEKNSKLLQCSGALCRKRGTPSSRPVRGRAKPPDKRRQKSGHECPLFVKPFFLSFPRYKPSWDRRDRGGDC